MEELRKLPILTIHDTDFYVDMAKLEFRQVDNPRNSIHFKDVGDFYLYTQVLYDPKTKNAFRGTDEELAARPDVVAVKLPAAPDLDFEYIMENLNKVAMQKYQERMQAKLNPEKDDEPSRNKQNKGRGI